MAEIIIGGGNGNAEGLPPELQALVAAMMAPPPTPQEQLGSFLRSLDHILYDQDHRHFENLDADLFAELEAAKDQASALLEQEGLSSDQISSYFEANDALFDRAEAALRPQ